MSIDPGPALRDPSLWKYLSADPSTNCSYADIATTSDFLPSDALANPVHDGLIFCQAMFSIQPLLSLGSRGRLVRFRGRKNWRYLCIFYQSPRRLRQQSMVRDECTDECLGQVVKQVPTISNLHCLGRSCFCCLRIQAGAVAADNLRARMSTKPFRSAFRTAVRQQIDDPSTFQVAENRAISMPLAPGPVIDTQYPRSLSGRLDQLAAQLTKECRTAGQNAELLRQPRPCGSAQCAHNLLERSAQPARAPRVPLYRFRQAFREDLLPTIASPVARSIMTSRISFSTIS